MFWDYLESTLQLILTIVMLLGCLFQYINSKKRGWIYLVLFFLGTPRLPSLCPFPSP